MNEEPQTTETPVVEGETPVVEETPADDAAVTPAEEKTEEVAPAA